MRFNPEIQRERRRELEGSLERRRKIMDRMTQGYACQHPSWVTECFAEGQEPAKQQDGKKRLAVA